jgi:hypothetical protein
MLHGIDPQGSNETNQLQGKEFKIPYEGGESIHKQPLTGKCPVSPALEGGVKGHNIKGKHLTGKPRPLGRGASLFQCFVLLLREIGALLAGESIATRKASGG